MTWDLKHFLMLLASGLCASLNSSTAAAEEPAESPADEAAVSFSPDDLQFFETKVRPLLAEHCYECHGAEKQKGELRLDSRQAILLGGESGAAAVPRKPAESQLLQAVRYESFEMPPSGKLPDEQVRILEEWIQRGIIWPESDSTTTPLRHHEKSFTDSDRAWWALQPLQEVAPPEVPDDAWSRNEIDHFIHSRLREQGMTPAAEADRVTLIRRVSFDLIGLPPTPEEVAAFVDDGAPDAYEKLVDRLLESPQYGERWARHWLDVVRYADSDGYRIDHYRPDAWRYRDYVIRSLNNDKPYDRFVQEQLAGDEMFPDNPDSLIATGYLRHWIYEYNNRDVRGQWDLIVNEVTDTTADVFLGVGLQCAKCHDHKYDPLLQKDYYRLRAFLEAIRPVDQYVVASTAEQQTYEQELKAWESESASIQAQIAELIEPYRTKARQEAISRYPEDIQAILHAPREARTPLEQQLFELSWRQVEYDYDGIDNRIKGEEKERLLALRRELAKFDARKPKALPTALVVTDIGPVAPDTQIPKKKVKVGPGFLSILDPADAVVPEPAPGQKTTGRRSALANWLTQPNNPLSTRVIVNRIWQGHFGRGLAQNASDFGTLGGPPTHPELLDWLTLRFVRNGWRFKDLHRLIVTSATYRQASDHPQLAEYLLKDPMNRDYWKFNVRRLDAEQIRDAILAASGQLDKTVGGPGVQSDVPRRSIYLRVMRNERDALLDVFDLPLFFNSTSSRDTTTSPVQSLLLFNSQIMMNHGLKFAMSLSAADSETQTLPDVLHDVWRRAFGRDPNETELSEAQQFLVEQEQRIRSERGQLDAASIPIGRLPYRDGQAILVTADDKSVRMSSEALVPMNSDAFTIEGCFQVRSIFENGSVRTLASRWTGSKDAVGWSMGITGKGSRRKPQTLVMQLFGKDRSGNIAEAALFSDQTVELNVPYYAAVSVTPATDKEPGTATFHLKNLSNDDEPLSSITVTHELISDFSGVTPLIIGGRGTAKSESSFDGLIDDIRLSSSVLSPEQLLINSDAPGTTTVAFWRFEPVPGVLEDSSTNALRLTLQRKEALDVTPEQTALADLCHVILNSNEFLYVK